MLREIEELAHECSGSPARLLDLVQSRYGVRVCVWIGVFELPSGQTGPGLRVFLPAEIHRRELGSPADVVTDLAYWQDAPLEAIVICQILTWLQLALEGLSTN